MLYRIIAVIGCLLLGLTSIQAGTPEVVRDSIHTDIAALETHMLREDFGATRMTLSSSNTLIGAIAWSQEGTRLYPQADQLGHAMDEPMIDAAGRLKLLASTATPWAAERADIRGEEYFYCYQQRAMVCVLLNVKAVAENLQRSSDDVLMALQAAPQAVDHSLSMVISLVVLVVASALLFWRYAQPAKHAATEAESFSLKHVTVYPRHLYAECFGKRVSVTERDVKLLRYFYQHPGQVMTKNELYDVAWGRDFVQNSRALEQHIINLRKKLDPLKSYPVIIETVHGQGYRFPGTA